MRARVRACVLGICLGGVGVFFESGYWGRAGCPRVPAKNDTWIQVGLGITAYTMSQELQAQLKHRDS